MSYSNLINKIIYIYYFFTILLITTLKYEVLYLNTIIGIGLIFLIASYKIMCKEKLYRNNIFLKVICYGYSVYIVITCLLTNRGELIYVINKVVPIILLCNFIDYIKLKSISINRLNKYLIKLFVIGIIFSGVLYLIDISYIQIGTYFKYVTKSEMMSLYGEGRLSGFLSHKSRFGVYCVIAIMMIMKQQEIEKINKLFLIGIIIYISYFSNSLITFFAILVAVALYFILDNMERFRQKKRLKYTIIMSLVLIVSAIVFITFTDKIGVLYTNRDFSNLGRRLDIWRYSLEYIKEIPYGTVKIPENLALGGYEFMNNAHNLFLNEFIESGLIGGILYLALVIVFIGYIRDPYIRMCYLLVIICSQFDKMISNEITFIFWGVYSIYGANRYLVNDEALDR